MASLTLTEFNLLIRGLKLDGSRRKVISKDWRNLFMPVRRVWGLEENQKFTVKCEQ